MATRKFDSRPTSDRDAKPEPTPAARPTSERASKPESEAKDEAKSEPTPEVNPASPTDKEVRAAIEQDDENMGPRTGTSPITQVDYRDGVDPISGARQAEKQRP